MSIIGEINKLWDIYKQDHDGAWNELGKAKCIHMDKSQQYSVEKQESSHRKIYIV